MRVLGHGVKYYAEVKPAAAAILAAASSGEGARADRDSGPLGSGRSIQEEALPVAVDRFAGRLHAVGDGDVAAGPAEHFKKSGFPAEFADLGVDDLPARKVNAPALFSALDPHGAGGEDAAFHLDQIGQRSAAGDSGESAGFVGWSGMHFWGEIAGAGTWPVARSWKMRCGFHLGCG